jgi:hypothetical protein
LEIESSVASLTTTHATRILDSAFATRLSILMASYARGRELVVILAKEWLMLS